MTPTQEERMRYPKVLMLKQFGRSRWEREKEAKQMSNHGNTIK